MATLTEDLALQCPPELAHLFQPPPGPGDAITAVEETGSAEREREEGSLGPPCLSLAERFLEMRHSEKLRLTCGTT